MQATVVVKKNFGRVRGVPKFGWKGHKLTVPLETARELEAEGLVTDLRLVREKPKPAPGDDAEAKISAVDAEIRQHETWLRNVSDELESVCADIARSSAVEVDPDNPSAIRAAKRLLFEARESLGALTNKRDNLAQSVRDLTIQRARLAYPVHHAAVARLADALNGPARKFVTATRESVAELLDELGRANACAQLCGSPSDVRALDVQAALVAAIERALYAAADEIVEKPSSSPDGPSAYSPTAYGF